MSNTFQFLSSGYSEHMDITDQSIYVGLSDEIFTLDNRLEGDHPLLVAPMYLENPPYLPLNISNPTQTGAVQEGPSSGECRKEATGAKERFAFRTKSEVEILDDGFKWRKYGKKKVKNSPNPRNYYKCAVEGCSIKKRVERDAEDPRYVITTYEGVHNHQGP